MPGQRTPPVPARLKVRSLKAPFVPIAGRIPGITSHYCSHPASKGERDRTSLAGALQHPNLKTSVLVPYLASIQLSANHCHRSEQTHSGSRGSPPGQGNKCSLNWRMLPRFHHHHPQQDAAHTIWMHQRVELDRIGLPSCHPIYTYLEAECRLVLLEVFS